MRVPPTENRGAQAARAAQEAQWAARAQEVRRFEELAHAGRLQVAQLRQEQEDLARGSVDLERRESSRPFSGPSC